MRVLLPVEQLPFVAFAVVSQRVAVCAPTVVRRPALQVLIELAPADRNGAYVAMMAMNAIDVLDEKARPLKDNIAPLPHVDPSAPQRANGYGARLVDKTLADLR